METTTIAVRRETLKLLQEVKQERDAGSFDSIIREILIAAKKPKQSLFGALKGVKKEFRREELDRFS
ncbi:MAG TPA: hypothetical protein VJH95_06360 [Candidatus Nanoarchaeia archaeon]|nr:hypothetical protein [Candidatus Nanoarchaeia archaeon]